MATQPVSMGRYWADASDLFFRRPLLWVPVLVADLIGSLLNIGQGALMHAIAMHRMQFHSALGGTVATKGLTMQAAQQLYIYAIALGWTTNFVRILLYVSAFVLTAGLVWTAGRRNSWNGAVAALSARVNGATLLALRALALYAAAAVGNTYLTRYLLVANPALLHSIWFRLGLAAVVVALQVGVLSNAALKVLTEKTPTEHGARSARLMALVLGFVALAMGFFIGQSSAIVRSATEEKRLVLEVLASLLTAVPYILMFLGYAVIAATERSESVDGEIIAAE
ncbi:hypothetical protein [Bryocella elongata]|nr:hypothetical protein [Bryocella elongata]